MEWSASFKVFRASNGCYSNNKKLLGLILIDYVIGVEIFSGKAIWKDPWDLPIRVDQRICFQEILIERRVYISNQKDKLLWAPTHDGKYSVKDGYVAF